MPTPLSPWMEIGFCIFIAYCLIGAWGYLRQCKDLPSTPEILEMRDRDEL